MKKGIYFWAAGLACAAPLAAADGLFSSGAASQGLAGAHAALASRPEDAALNPAALLGLSRPALSLQGGALFDAAQGLAGASAAAPAGLSQLALGLHAERVWTLATGNHAQRWGAALAVPVEDGFGLGLGLHYVETSYGDPGRGLGLDLGTRWESAPKAWGRAALALSVLDLDTVSKHDSGLEQRLPQVVKLGAAWWPAPGWSLALDQDFSDLGGGGGARSYALRAGAEGLFWRDRLALRMGYQSLSGLGSPDPFGGSERRFTAGLGLRMGGLLLDYAFVPSSGALGASHRASAGWVFAAPPQPAPRAALRLTRTLAGDGLALLQWEDPGGDGQTSYTALMSVDGSAYFSRVADTGGGQRSLELRGLRNGSPHTIKVMPKRADGSVDEAAATEAVMLRPSAPAPGLKELLERAGHAFESGDAALARALASRAQQMDPLSADAALLAERLRRLALEE